MDYLSRLDDLHRHLSLHWLHNDTLATEIVLAHLLDMGKAPVPPAAIAPPWIWLETPFNSDYTVGSWFGFHPGVRTICHVLSARPKTIRYEAEMLLETAWDRLLLVDSTATDTMPHGGWGSQRKRARVRVNIRLTDLWARLQSKAVYVQCPKYARHPPVSANALRERDLLAGKVLDNQFRQPISRLWEPNPAQTFTMELAWKMSGRIDWVDLIRHTQSIMTRLKHLTGAKPVIEADNLALARVSGDYIPYTSKLLARSMAINEEGRRLTLDQCARKTGHDMKEVLWRWREQGVAKYTVTGVRRGWEIVDNLKGKVLELCQ